MNTAIVYFTALTGEGTGTLGLGRRSSRGGRSREGGMGKKGAGRGRICLLVERGWRGRAGQGREVRGGRERGGPPPGSGGWLWFCQRLPPGR